MRGRKPKPTALKLIADNPGGRRLNENEPKPTVTSPRAPGHLNPEAGAKWDEMVVMFEAHGLMTEFDVDALAMYCNSFAEWLAAKEEIATNGQTVKSPKSGYEIASPYLAIKNSAEQTMRSLMAEFGLTPSSRTRIPGHAIPKGRDKKGSAANRLIRKG